MFLPSERWRFTQVIIKPSGKLIGDALSLAGADPISQCLQRGAVSVAAWSVDTFARVATALTKSSYST